MTAHIKRSYPRECHTSEQGKLPCTCGALHTMNSDGSNPAEESRDLVEFVLDCVLLALVVVVLVVTVFTLAGFWSNHV